MDEFRISVILPVLNEARRLPAALASVRSGAPLETIVVDGGSKDESAGVARRHGARVVRSATGRGAQMNAGAAVARGDVLLFLHADSMLPGGWAGEVQRLLAEPRCVAGAFRLAIDGEERSFRWIERVANLRSRIGRLPYGDQGLFLSAATFHAVGGFPEIPLLEDVALVRRLGRAGRTRISELAVRTSARRWRRDGILRATARNGLALAGWMLGMRPEWIACWTGRLAPTTTPASSIVDPVSRLPRESV